MIVNPHPFLSSAAALTVGEILSNYNSIFGSGALLITIALGGVRFAKEVKNFNKPDQKKEF